jgi:hypothetical protein
MDEHVHSHEGTDVKARPLALFFVAFLALCGIGFVIAKWGYDALVKYENARQKDKVTRVTAQKSEIPETLKLRAGGPEVATLPSTESMLQPDPVRDMNAMRDAQLGRLSSYGWVDREKGVVHIPIEKAMAMAIERSMVKAQAPELASTAAPVAAGAAPASTVPQATH